MKRTSQSHHHCLYFSQNKRGREGEGKEEKKEKGGREERKKRKEGLAFEGIK